MIQTYLLDCHFSLEQQSRSNAGYFLNFNGTAGMWRKQCIMDVGGWNGSVLTEDLELSYRAQLNGWKFMYDQNVVVPADLPVDMEGFKTQQFRWAKGLAQSAKCHLMNVYKAKINFSKKLHAAFHLLSSISFLAVFGNFLFALPIIVARHQLPGFRTYSEIIAFTGITLPILITYYAAGTKGNLSRLQFWKHLPLFLVVYMGLSFQNTIAVLQGLTGISSPFVRTPKPGNNLVVYNEPAKRWSWINWFEFLSLIYIIITITLALVWGDYFLLTFLVMGAIGLVLILKTNLSALFSSTNRQQAPVIRLPARDVNRFHDIQS
ncbi:MAG: hypothetical protein EOO02_22665 [Chitinophagaceae bacterium]|nr:MAG: hypothetical protein EOO02_22665 [Chitinophagaceae bacterium]